MLDWQDIAAISLVALAGAFVAWRVWRTITTRRTAGCGSGCGKCSSADRPQVMQIELTSGVPAGVTAPAPQSGRQTAER